MRIKDNEHKFNIYHTCLSYTFWIRILTLVLKIIFHLVARLTVSQSELLTRRINFKRNLLIMNRNAFNQYNFKSSVFDSMRFAFGSTLKSFLSLYVDVDDDVVVIIIIAMFLLLCFDKIHSKSLRTTLKCMPWLKDSLLLDSQIKTMNS